MQVQVVKWFEENDEKIFLKTSNIPKDSPEWRTYGLKYQLIELNDLMSVIINLFYEFASYMLKTYAH